MAPGWFAPPGAHAMRPQQGQQQPGGGRFHPAGHTQRMPRPGVGMSANGGVNSPLAHTYHQRSSPPMRGPYHGGPRPHAPPPHGVVAHPPHGPPRMAQGFQQHPQGMVAARPLPPTTHPGGHGHNSMARHHAPSPGMPRRMQIPPPNAMQPIPQQARPAYDPQRGSVLQQHPQHGPPRGMHQHQQHQHMMRMQQEHQQQQQLHEQRPGLYHHHHPSAIHEMHRQMGEGHSHYQPPPPPPPGTPEQRPSHSHGTQSRSPSPPAIPPPPNFQQDQSTEGSQRPSPASIPDTEASASADHSDRSNHTHHPPPPPISKTPSWNQGSGLGPLRESRLQNMPQKRLMVPMQQHPHHHHHPHAQRPIPQHPHSVSANAYINENMERFRAMELKQHHRPHGMKPIYHMPPQMMMHHPSARTTIPSPGLPHPHNVMRQQQAQQQQSQLGQEAGSKSKAKKGPDITMDAASMLLALRTSASPSTVSAATLEEQVSRDQSEASKKNTAGDQQDHDDLEDDDVPALASSSSSLSAPPPKPAVQHHEVPKNFPTRLALPNDEAKLNSLHCFLRSELLEIFVVERSANKSPTHSPGSSVGRVGLRCVFCAMVRKRHAMSVAADPENVTAPQQPFNDEAPMSVFYPKSIAEIYRLVTSWQRCHLRKCRNLPPDIRSKWQLLRENDKSRGKTHYWITSAKEIGLTDCNSRAGGIRFATPRSNSAASGSIVTALSGAADNDSIISEGLYNQGQEHDGVHNMAQGYQPHNNPNFMEGPSQKHREALGSRDVVSSATVSTIQSPLKVERESTEEERTVTGEAPSETPVDTLVTSGGDSAVDATVDATVCGSEDAPPPSPQNDVDSKVTDSANFSAVSV